MKLKKPPAVAGGFLTLGDKSPRSRCDSDLLTVAFGRENRPRSVRSVGRSVAVGDLPVLTYKPIYEGHAAG